MSGCSRSDCEDRRLRPSIKMIGSQSSRMIWVYLCGLTTEFIPEYMHEIKSLDVLGKELDIKFLVIIPTERCSQLNNYLCWPHDTQQDLLKTYYDIIDKTHNYEVQGYIGFSNGGFFLNRLVQFIDIDKPVISIGSAGLLLNENGPLNTIYLLIGKNDQWHYDHAINFYKQSKNSNLTIHLTEYDGGHEIPQDVLRNMLIKLSY